MCVGFTLFLISSEHTFGSIHKARNLSRLQMVGSLKILYVSSDSY